MSQCLSMSVIPHSLHPPKTNPLSDAQAMPKTSDAARMRRREYMRGHRLQGRQASLELSTKVCHVLMVATSIQLFSGSNL